MVVKKYLCAAPRQEAWEEKAAALLQALGGSRSKRAAVVKRTLAALQKEHGSEKRTGPGRRSNGEHAMAFYEYLLNEDGDVDDDAESISEMEVDGTENDSQTGDDDTGLEVEDKTDNNYRSNNNNDDDASATSATGSQNSQTVESMDTQEFLNQHDDECEVCSQPGELLCCSTCSLSFHMKCLRPTLASLPKEEDDWSCPYCILQDVKGHKRHSKVWKSAAAGVRQMGRLRNKTDREQQPSCDESEDSDDKQNTKPAARMDEESSMDEEHEPTSTNETCATVESKKEESAATENEPGEPLNPNTKRRKLALYKLSDPFKPAVDPAKDLVVKGRRSRRQPTVYQPQSCPDSQWKSDELHLPRGSSDDDDVSETSDQQEQHGPNHRREKIKAMSKDSKGAGTASDSVDTTKTQTASAETPKSERSAPGEAFCLFCMDDPSISLCVFCACRECFGKHKQDKIVKCVKCGDIYHSFCVGLKSIPSDKAWMCKSCDKAPEEKISTRRASTSIFAKSRPTKVKSDALSDLSAASFSHPARATKSPSEKKIATGSSEKQSRGRPKSKSLPPTSRKSGSGRSPKSAGSKDSASPKKRGPGRPPKSKSLSVTPAKRGRPPKAVTEAKRKAEAATLSAPSGKKRGRPPKKISSTSEVKRRGPGRPPKSDASISPAAKVIEPAAPPEPPKFSRSGRVVKRQSFHDEIYQGEQHLKTSRSADQGDDMYTPQVSSGRGRSKSNDSTESRKRQKTVKDESNATASERGPLKTEEEKEEEVLAPVRMKLVLEPSASAVRPLQAETKQSPVASVKEAAQSIVVTVGAAPAVAPAAVAVKTPAAPVAHTKPAVSASGSSIVSTAKTPPSYVPAPTMATTTKPATAFSTSLSRPAVATSSTYPSTPLLDPKKLEAAIKALPSGNVVEEKLPPTKTPRRKPGARECMQLSRRFGNNVIPEKSMNVLLDYCSRGKVEHLIRMRERLDCHSRYLESQIAGLEILIKERGETDVVVPPLPASTDLSNQSKHRTFSEGSGGDVGTIASADADKPLAASPAPLDVIMEDVEGSTGDRLGSAAANVVPQQALKTAATVGTATTNATPKPSAEAAP
ncbi:MAG: hypothetical protein SGILL_004451 [Bacillariaceae sp.]